MSPGVSYFVLNEDIRNKLAQAGLSTTSSASLHQRPWWSSQCADLRIASRYGERGAQLYCIQDTAVSIQNLLLTAHDLGLGTCWVGAFKEEEVKEILDMPDYLRSVVIVPVGYPAQTPKRLTAFPRPNA